MSNVPETQRKFIDRRLSEGATPSEIEAATGVSRAYIASRKHLLTNRAARRLVRRLLLSEGLVADPEESKVD